MVKGLQKIPLFGIVMVALACDNVEWGGIDVGLRAPSASIVQETSAATTDTLIAPEQDVPRIPALYLGRRVGSEAWLVPIAEVHADGLRALPDSLEPEGSRSFAERHFAPGSTFVLFSDGVRVGTLTASEYGPDVTYCGARPRVRGPIELTPQAASSASFLAVPSELATSIPHQAYAPATQTRDLRVTSLNMMTALLPTLGSPWPESVLGIRRDVQVFNDPDGSAPTVVATFVYGDSLRVGPAPANGYSVFLVASNQDGNEYGTTYVDHRIWREHGKGAARYFGRMDVDGDDTPELVLEVVGERSTWISVLKQQGDRWVETYHDPCGLPAPTPSAAP